MPITGVSSDEYEAFLRNGGTLVFEIDKTDIDPSGGFEQSKLIQPFLTTGFELRPSPIIDDPVEGEKLLLFGGAWTRVVTATYRRGGKVVYKKLPGGRYEATVSAPQRNASEP